MQLLCFRSSVGAVDRVWLTAVHPGCEHDVVSVGIPVKNRTVGGPVRMQSGLRREAGIAEWPVRLFNRLGGVQVEDQLVEHGRRYVFARSNDFDLQGGVR